MMQKMGTARLIMVAALMSCLPPTTCGQVTGKGHRSEMVRFKSTLDGSLQPAIIHIPRENRDNPVPLLVMLHTWGSSFATNYAAESLAECGRNS